MENKTENKPVKADYLTHYDFSAMIGGRLQSDVEGYSRSLLAYNYHIKKYEKELHMEGISVEMNDVLDLVQSKVIDDIVGSMSLQLINYLDQLRTEVMLLKKLGKFTPKLREGTLPMFPNDYAGD